MDLFRDAAGALRPLLAGLAWAASATGQWLRVGPLGRHLPQTYPDGKLQGFFMSLHPILTWSSFGCHLGCHWGSHRLSGLHGCVCPLSPGGSALRSPLRLFGRRKFYHWRQCGEHPLRSSLSGRRGVRGGPQEPLSLEVHPAQVDCGVKAGSCLVPVPGPERPSPSSGNTPIISTTREPLC